jgi:hypothetical protein
MARSPAGALACLVLFAGVVGGATSARGSVDGAWRSPRDARLWDPFPMADDWRVELDVEDHDVVHRALDRLRERGVARAARHDLGEGVTISVDADRIFAYAQSLEQARHAESVLTELAREHHLDTNALIAQWRPDEGEWKPVTS